MQITSLPFLLGAFGSVFIYYLIDNRLRNIFLVLLSVAFIASLSPGLMFYVIFFALVNYFLAIKIASAGNKKILFRTGLFFNIFQIFILKYASFSLGPLLDISESTIHLRDFSSLIIPIGISYFTLQGIGYLTNVKMGWEKPESNFIDFLLYITFFPKFISGPIERSNHFLPQIKGTRTFNEADIASGIKTVLTGLFKKIVIANQLAPFIMSAHSGQTTANGIDLWIVLLLGPLFLYFDFSGYTDIAIGIARAFGINLLPNFFRPFFSENMTTFWRRFHISLSSWFNDYIFKQLSFRYRKTGIYASIIAVFVTWILFGIWHGAGWNFMVLGVCQALAIYYEFFTKKLRIRIFSKTPDTLRIWMSRFVTYVFYGFSLIFFFSPDLKSALKYFSGLTHFGETSIIGPLSLIPISLIVSVILIFFLELLQNDYENLFMKIDKVWSGDRRKLKIMRWSVYSLMILCIYIVGNKAFQFIYVNF